MDARAPVTERVIDRKVPLELYEAQNAVELARFAGADRYAEVKNVSESAGSSEALIKWPQARSLRRVLFPCQASRNGDDPLIHLHSCSVMWRQIRGIGFDSAQPRQHSSE